VSVTEQPCNKVLETHTHSAVNNRHTTNRLDNRGSQRRPSSLQFRTLTAHCIHLQHGTIVTDHNMQKEL